VGAALRKQVYKKTNGRCAFCNMKLTLNKLNRGSENQRMTIDHIIPKSKGGESILDNYQPLCTRCNQCKGSLLEDEMEVKTWMIKLKQK